jgi:hypothetical protein
VEVVAKYITYSSYHPIQRSALLVWFLLKVDDEIDGTHGLSQLE